MKQLQRGKIFGMVTVGERGQIVIPAGLRKLFGVGAGDKLVAFAKPRMFGFIAAEEFNRYVSELSRIAKRIKISKKSKGKSKKR